MKKRKIKVIQRRASFSPETINEDKRTVDLVFSTGSEVKRFPFFDEPFIEELGMKPSNVRLDRLNNGAPFLKDHAANIDNVAGVVENARVTKGEGLATVRFGKDDESDKVFQKVKDGILRNISVGYRVHEFTEMKPREDGTKVLRATDWEPLELSAVAIPADAGAQFRDVELRSYEENDCKFIRNNGGDEMLTEEQKKKLAEEKLIAERKIEAEKIEAAKKVADKPEVDLEAIRKEAVEVERKRVDGIKKALTVGEFDEKFERSLLDGDVSLERAREMILDKLAKDNEGSTVNVTAGEQDEKEEQRKGAVRALLSRHNGAKYKIEGDDNYGRQYRYYSLLDIVRDCAKRSGINVAGLSPMEVAKRGMHSTSDFPLLLADVSNKTLRDAYDEAPATWAPITRMVTEPNFKNINRNQFGDFPNLAQVTESGEYTKGTISEGREQYTIRRFGKIITMTRELVINDDLNAFSRLPEMMGRAARRLENDSLWNQITDNTLLMGDGLVLYVAGHSNLQTGAAISVASLGIMRAAMRNQTGLDGALLNLEPRYLIVPPELETIAQQFTRSITPEQGANVNPFSGALQVITEPRIATGTGGSTDDWYFAASPGQVDILELARLQGEEGPMIETETDFDTDGVSMKVRHEIGFKTIDHRGLQKNPGS